MLRVFEYWELRNMLPSRREEVTGGCKKLHKEDNIKMNIKWMTWDGMD